MLDLCLKSFACRRKKREVKKRLFDFYVTNDVGQFVTFSARLALTNWVEIFPRFHHRQILMLLANYSNITQTTISITTWHHVNAAILTSNAPRDRFAVANSQNALSKKKVSRELALMQRLQRTQPRLIKVMKRYLRRKNFLEQKESRRSFKMRQNRDTFFSWKISYTKKKAQKEMRNASYS